MSEVKLRATVNDQGRLAPEAPSVWAASLSQMRGKRVTVTIETEANRRSAQANRYYWGCVIPVFQEVWSLARTSIGMEPLTKDETHEVLVQVLVGTEEGPMPGTRVRKRTSTKDSPWFRAYVDKARELALHQYGMAIPAPGEEYEAEEA